jgi:hypothetical protein
MAIICASLAKPNLIPKTPLLRRRNKLIEVDASKKEDNIWEAIQLINGDIFIYHKGFKEEAPMEDVFKYAFGGENKLIRFDVNLMPPVHDGGTVRVNRAVIAFAWYVDPDSEIVQLIKKVISEQKG